MEHTRYEKLEKKLKEAAEQERKKRKQRKILTIASSWLLVVVLLVVFVVGAFAIVREVGAKSLRAGVEDGTPTLQDDDAISSIADIMENQNEVAELEWQEDWIGYNGKIYDYKEDVMTFLVMGVDRDGPIATEGPYVGGQSDALFLVVADPKDETVKIVGINRDTMVDVIMIGAGGIAEGKTTKAQITVQHAYGNSEEESCQLTKDAVSHLFYDLPIHGYIALNMGAIAPLNDSVGGVTVTVMEDMTDENKEWYAGNQVTLQGQEAYAYVRHRDTGEFESARQRLDRQKAYLTAFINQSVAETKKDITTPVTLYQELSKYMVTDISVDEVTYLVNEMQDYQFESEIYTMQGTTVEGKKHEEFTPDEEALRELMLAVFYEEVEVPQD